MVVYLFQNCRILETIQNTHDIAVLYIQRCQTEMLRLSLKDATR